MSLELTNKENLNKIDEMNEIINNFDNEMNRLNMSGNLSVNSNDIISKPKINEIKTENIEYD